MILSTKKDNLNYDEVLQLYRDGDYLSIAFLEHERDYNARDAWKAACKSEQWPIIKKLMDNYSVSQHILWTAHIYKIRDLDLLAKVKAKLASSNMVKIGDSYPMRDQYRSYKAGYMCAHRPCQEVVAYIKRHDLNISRIIRSMVRYDRLDILIELVHINNLHCGEACRQAAGRGNLRIFEAYSDYYHGYDDETKKFCLKGLLLVAYKGGNQVIIDIVKDSLSKMDGAIKG